MYVDNSPQKAQTLLQLQRVQTLLRLREGSWVLINLGVFLVSKKVEEVLCQLILCIDISKKMLNLLSTETNNSTHSPETTTV